MYTFISLNKNHWLSLANRDFLYYVYLVEVLSVYVFSVLTGDGEVYVWNMNTRSCVHKFRDEGCLNSTTLAASADGQYLACG